MFNSYGYYTGLPFFRDTLGSAKYVPKRSQKIKNKRKNSKRRKQRK